VALCLDELFSLQKLAGGSLEDVLAIARSYKLRLLAACQHLDQLEDGLRKSLLANTAVQVYFRLGYQDARLVAASLAAGAEETVTRLSLDVAGRDRRTGKPLRAEVRHTVRDAHGRPLRISPAAWEELRWDGMFRPGGWLPALERLAAASGAGRLYVQAADTGEPMALSRYVAPLKEGEWWLLGPAPLRLVVSFPKPKISNVERRGEGDLLQTYTRTLQDMPVQHALLRTQGQPPTVFRVVDVPTPAGLTPDLARYLEASVRANGQSAEEIARAKRDREHQVVRVASGISGINEDGPLLGDRLPEAGDAIDGDDKGAADGSIA
jgi:hypothetical protein